MQTANDFARMATQIGQLALEVKPDDADPYAQTRKLIQYHLQVAATKCRDLADAIGESRAAGK